MSAKTAVPELRRAVFARDRHVWREWLARYHDSAAEVWLLLFKKHTQTRCVSLSEAVEEALCFGWIDGRLRRVDDERHVLRFCPRRPRSVWSETNKARVIRLIKEGRMTPAGLEAVRIAKKNGQWQAAHQLERTSAVPADLTSALAANRRAASFFEALAPSYRKMYVAWVLTAKRAETRARRIQTVVSRLARGVKPGIDL